MVFIYRNFYLDALQEKEGSGGYHGSDNFRNSGEAHKNEDSRITKQRHHREGNEEEHEKAHFYRKHAHLIRGSNRHPQNYVHKNEHAQTEHVDGSSIADAIAEKDRKIRQQQAATLMKIQKQEVNDDLMKLKEVTQDGLQSMFAKAVAKQQKFIDDVQGPQESDGSELFARDQLQQQDEVSNEKLFDVAEQDEQKSMIPIDNDQFIERGNYNGETHSFNEPRAYVDEYEDEVAGRKDRITGSVNDREVYDDDIIDPDEENDEENEREEYYDSDKKRIID